MIWSYQVNCGILEMHIFDVKSGQSRAPTDLIFVNAQQNIVTFLPLLAFMFRPLAFYGKLGWIKAISLASLCNTSRQKIVHKQMQISGSVWVCLNPTAGFISVGTQVLCIWSIYRKKTFLFPVKLADGDTFDEIIWRTTIKTIYVNH